MLAVVKSEAAGREYMEKKRISVSQKRQITIPQKYFEMLGIGSEVECFVRNGELVIKPISETGSGEFAEEILKELVNKGLSGEELLKEFREMNRKVRPAVEAIIYDADKMAREKMGTGDDKVAEIFDAEE